MLIRGHLGNVGRDDLLRRFWRRLFGAFVDHLVDDAEVARHLGGEEFVAFQRILDRLEGLTGMLHVNLVQPLLQVQDFLGVQHDVGSLPLERYESAMSWTSEDSAKK
jgi:hypothetical protein